MTTSLADHYGGSGDYLPVGDHEVVVESYKAVQSSKNEGIEFTLAVHGEQARIAFWLTDKALFRLAKFAEACGIPQDSEAAQRYDPYIFQSHRVLVNRRLMVRVAKGEKYHEVASFWALSEEAPDYAEPEAAVATQAPAAATQEAPISIPDDNIPF